MRVLVGPRDRSAVAVREEWRFGQKIGLSDESFLATGPAALAFAQIKRWAGCDENKDQVEACRGSMTAHWR